MASKVTKQEGNSERKVYLRKATFTSEVVKGERVFHAVNKRAHKWARKQGKRSRLTLAEMRAIKATGRVKLFENNGGTLKAIRL